MRWRPVALGLGLLAALALAWGVVRVVRSSEPDPVREIPTAGDAPVSRPGLGARPRPSIDPGTEAPPQEIPSEEGAEPMRPPMVVRVVSDADGSPIEGAAVTFAEREYEWMRRPAVREVALTGSDGRATVQGTSSFSIDWTIRKRGFLTAFFDRNGIAFDDKGPREAVRLTPAPPLLGRIIEFGTRTGVARARVALWDADDWSKGLLDAPQTTGPDGAFEFAGAPTTRYLRIAAAAEGLGGVILSLRPGEGRRPVEIELGRGASITGTIRDEQGAPVAGAEVFAAERGGDDPLEPPEWDLRRGLRSEAVEVLRTHARSGADGAFVLRGLVTPTTYVVSARGAGGACGTADAVEVARDGESRAGIDVTIARSGRIVVSCRAPSAGGADPFTRSVARAWRDGAWHEVPERQRAGAWTERHEFAFESVLPGPHRVYLDVDGFLLAAQDVVVRPGERADMSFTLDPGLAIRGRLVDRAGLPVRGFARFSYEIEGIPDSRGAEAGSDGRFTVEGLPRVVGTLRGSADGYADAERDGVLPGASDAGTLALTRAARVVLRLRDALPFSVMPCATVTTGDGHSETYDVPSGDGSVEVTWAPPDVRFDLSVAARGFAPIDRTGLLVPAGSTLDLGEVAFPEPRVLAGVVRDATGAPAVGATIRVLGSSSSSSPEASCDEEGRFRLAPLGLGPATVVVLVGGQRWTSVTTQVRRPEESVEIRLPAPGTISATVRDARGEPVASLPLNLWLIGPDGAPEERHRTIVRTDSVGRVEVRLAPGRYRLEPHSAARRGWSKPVPDFDLASDATVTLDLAVDGH